MLRIISGQLKGHLFKALPTGRSHPMSDRAKMALFNILGDLSDVEAILDAYAGSGALAFEALSRAPNSSAVVIEVNQRVYTQLSQNVGKLRLGSRVQIFRANNLTCLNNLQQQFDLILLDPPYDDLKEDNLLQIGNYLTTNGRLVLSHPPHFVSPFQLPAWRCLHAKAYAQLHLKIYAKKEATIW